MCAKIGNFPWKNACEVLCFVVCDLDFLSVQCNASLRPHHADQVQRQITKVFPGEGTARLFLVTCLHVRVCACVRACVGGGGGVFSQCKRHRQSISVPQETRRHALTKKSCRRCTLGTMFTYCAVPMV